MKCPASFPGGTMTFDNSFFEDEVREGFYVPAMMKRNWAAQMEVLQMFSKFCKENDIRWFAAYGTLLGAVRHKGFIPWDDDVDVWMLRKDYEKFLRVVNMMPEDIQFAEGRFGELKGFDQPFGRITNRGLRYQVQDNEDAFMRFMDRYHGFLDLAGVDIFVLDRMAPTEEEEQERWEACRMLWYLITHVNAGDEESRKNVEDGIEKISAWLNQPIDRKGNPFQQFLIIFEALSAEFEDAGGTELIAMHDWMGYRGYHFPASCFEDTVDLPFENITVKAPIGYREVLSRWHSDYMVPRQDVTHNYPCYRAFEQGQENDGHPLPYLYRFRKDEMEKPVREGRKAVFKRMTKLLLQMNDLVKETILSADASALSQALGSLQELTTQFGSLLVSAYPKEAAAVCEQLNRYHELLFGLYQKLTDPSESFSADEIAVILEEMNRTVGTIRRQMDEQFLLPKEIVFLPFKAEGWKKMRPLYDYFQGLPDVKVYVTPVSWFRKNDRMQSIPEPVNEGDDIAEDVEITPADQMILALHTPDLVISQNTYDQYSVGMSVDNRFYSRELQKYAGKVVYMPWFTTDEVDLHHPAAMAICRDYINMPGVLHADKVLVPSYNMRHMYISRLTSFAGEDTWKHWEKTVQKMDSEEDMRILFPVV